MAWSVGQLVSLTGPTAGGGLRCGRVRDCNFEDLDLDLDLDAFCLSFLLTHHFRLYTCAFVCAKVRFCEHRGKWVHCRLTG